MCTTMGGLLPCAALALLQTCAQLACRLHALFEFADRPAKQDTYHRACLDVEVVHAAGSFLGA
jgi:hypothetical protein